MKRNFAAKVAFHAELVAAQQEEFTDDCTVHGIYFGTGDPELGGQHWNFTRTPGEDDEGVCTVKEIQEVVVYGGITLLSMSRTTLMCEFDTETAQETGARRLEITYTIDDQTWAGMIEQSQFIFQGERYFVLEQ